MRRMSSASLSRRRAGTRQETATGTGGGDRQRRLSVWRSAIRLLDRGTTAGGESADYDGTNQRGLYFGVENFLQQVSAIDKDQPVARPITLEEIIGYETAQPR